ncbi:hypothetical protein GKG47_19570 [Lactonifactor sp. BIOML-A3]|uniref:hypothetical protein n=1 Tax=unclassified Lactonifactor TaxID=2636670 RepID=UPI0012B02CAF|nr:MULTISPECIES: hypothetical protein [unclassified Lactonifactor]MSA03611.1 hypothetical protein [Lactonifactor sp. BIOML-A5]MSA10112.1 hypothetical protein [Lactonifactor sp. BIOML-A4]MSA14618.1 hypothetical protein [Lactonifactor sp. BIOML-A3]MSA19040.1 hypothetical protein [Lactonifactor sp. BIOML-A2]MSA39758.1 hypothetical protein [Lactonifactor sp. BIOML-A1]
MMKKNKVKECPCGRIITDPKNKTGLCPRCQKKANAAGAGVGILAFGVGVKKYGGKILEGAIDIARKIK